MKIEFNSERTQWEFLEDYRSRDSKHSSSLWFTSRDHYQNCNLCKKFNSYFCSGYHSLIRTWSSWWPWSQIKYFLNINERLLQENIVQPSLPIKPVHTSSMCYFFFFYERRVQIRLTTNTIKRDIEISLEGKFSTISRNIWPPDIWINIINTFFLLNISLFYSLPYKNDNTCCCRIDIWTWLGE